jgi:hypothetical protein
MLRLPSLALACALALSAAASGCATTHHDGRGKAKKERVAAKKKKKGGLADYSLYSQSKIDKRLLKRGQRFNGTAALSSY